MLTHVGTQDKASVAKTPASIVATDILKLGALEVAKLQEAKFQFLLLQALLKVTPAKSNFFFRGVVGHRILNGQVGHRILNGQPPPKKTSIFTGGRFLTYTLGCPGRGTIQHQPLGRVQGKTANITRLVGDNFGLVGDVLH